MLTRTMPTLKEAEDRFLRDLGKYLPVMRSAVVREIEALCQEELDTRRAEDAARHDVPEPAMGFDLQELATKAKLVIGPLAGETDD